MKQIDMNIRALPYAVEEAMNRLRVNIKFCGKNTKKNTGYQQCSKRG